jgi:hypothetical protein
MPSDRQRPLEIRLSTKIGVTPAWSQFEDQHGPSAITLWAASKLFDRPIDGGFDVRVGIAGERQADPNQSTVSEFSRSCSTCGRRLVDLGLILSPNIRTVGAGAGWRTILLRLLRGNLTDCYRCGLGVPQNDCREDGQANCTMAGTYAEIANHKLLQSLNPPKFAPTGFW